MDLFEADEEVLLAEQVDAALERAIANSEALRQRKTRWANAS
jgi:hypothetical protein